MREIFFRGKRVDDGKWIEGQPFGSYWIIISGSGGRIYEDGEFEGCGCYEIDPDTVGEYTGLPDRNGKKIFEGDIVKNIEHGFKYTVAFSSERGGWFPFARDDGCGCCSMDVETSSEVAIIGNIHDNPELLESPYES